MLISHKNTGTIGDFASIWPTLSGLSKIYGPLDLTLPNCYLKQFNGIKEFLEYQDFFNNVDFDDRDADLDVQAYQQPIHGGPLPTQPHRCHYEIEKKLNIIFDIDFDLKLKVPHIEIPEEIKNKYIVIDRVKTRLIEKYGLFQNKNEYYWINPTVFNHGPDRDSNGDSMFYNINICLQTNKGVKAMPTGLPIVLHLFNNIKMDIIGLCYDGDNAWDWSYLRNRPNVTFTKSEDFFKQNNLNRLFN
jgi:hypothetical protein